MCICSATARVLFFFKKNKLIINHKNKFILVIIFAQRSGRATRVPLSYNTGARPMWPRHAGARPISMAGLALPHSVSPRTL